MLGKNYQRPDSGPLVQLPRLKVIARAAVGPLETHFSAVLKQIAVSVTVPLTVE